MSRSAAILGFADLAARVDNDYALAEVIGNVLRGRPTAVCLNALGAAGVAVMEAQKAFLRDPANQRNGRVGDVPDPVHGRYLRSPTWFGSPTPHAPRRTGCHRDSASTPSRSSVSWLDVREGRRIQRTTHAECVGSIDRGRLYRLPRRPAVRASHPLRASLLISVVEPFVERNGVLRCPALRTVSTLTCTDGLGEHRVPDEVRTRNA